MEKANTTYDRFEVTASISVFLFFAIMLSVPSGYSFGAALLLLTSTIFLFKRPRLELSVEDKTLVALLLVIFLIALFFFLLRGNPAKTMDQASRYMLAIPILFFLLKVPPRLSYVWAGLIVGGISSAGITLWQRQWLGIERATGFVTSAIPYGDISLVIAILCVVGLFWTGSLQRYIWRWRLALALATVAGFYSVVASETRGGWLAVPPIVILFCVGFAKAHNARRTIGGTLAVVFLLGLFFVFSPNNGTKARYEIAIQQAQKYNIHNLQSTSNAVGGRLAAWQTALASISEKPILGWSYNDYEEKLQSLDKDREVNAYVADLANTHNQYLEIWLHQGIVGLLATLFLYVYVFRCFCRRLTHRNLKVRTLAVSGASLLVAYFMFGMTQVILGRNNGVISFVLTLIILWTCMRHEENSAAGSLA